MILWQSYPLKSVVSKLRLLGFKNIKKFFLHCNTYGLNNTIQLAAHKLLKSNIVLTPTINPLHLPKLEVSDNEGQPPIIDKKVSIVIPTKNAGKDFRHLLKKLTAQKGLREIEIIIVDSGSTDETLNIAKEERASVVEISPDDFNHAYSRNKGAEYADGDYVLFTVQDALPLTDHWIRELVTALEQNNVVAVSCAEYPRADCDLFSQWMIWNHHKTLNLDQDRIFGWDESCGTYLGLRSNSQLNDVATLIRKDIFDRYRFRKKYAEDLDLGLRLIQDGYRIGFLYSTRVLHSHNRPAYYFLRRSYVDSRFLKDVFDDFPFPAINDSQNLFQQITELYSKTKQVVAYLRGLKETDYEKVPELMNRIRDMYSRDCDKTEIPGTRFGDNSLEAFIQKLASFIRDKTVVPKSGENILLPHFLNNLALLQTYISQSHENVDEHLLHELETALFKLTALNGGAHMAYLYLTLSGLSAVERFPAELDVELRSGI